MNSEQGRVGKAVVVGYMKAVSMHVYEENHEETHVVNLLVSLYV
jgi:hypothetical protein